MGYLLLPEGLGIQSVRVIIRSDSGNEIPTLTIAQPRDYDLAKVKTQAEQLPQAKAAPIKNEKPSLPEPKQAPRTQDI